MASYMPGFARIELDTIKNVAIVYYIVMSTVDVLIVLCYVTERMLVHCCRLTSDHRDHMLYWRDQGTPSPSQVLSPFLLSVGVTLL